MRSVKEVSAFAHLGGSGGLGPGVTWICTPLAFASHSASGTIMVVWSLATGRDSDAIDSREPPLRDVNHRTPC